MTVITYCVEYAESQKSTCLKCNKIIPNRSLRFGKMQRTSEKEKKKFAKHTWYHFKCFEMPEVLTKIPIHLIRGQVNLLDKDKVRLEKVIKLGPGGSWNQIVEQHKKKAKEELDEATAQAIANGTPLPVPATKNEIDSDDEAESRDFTSQLTGEVDKKQERKNRKINKLKANTAGAKVAKKAGPPKPVKANTTGKPSPKFKEMSAVEKAIASTRNNSQKKLAEIKSKFGKK
ncbi:hypothetical protein BGZ76_004737 [Entomortierella beljakovae]|nr:hypothetical protein BGZ76_004737 [Entomortierella beljakovae]